MMVARKLKLTSWFQKVFHRSSTGLPQASALLKMEAERIKLASLSHEVTLIRRDVKDFEERVQRKLERYRTWNQSRKGGKFGNQGLEDDAESPNQSTPLSGHTHKSIAAAARKQGLIS